MEVSFKLATLLPLLILSISDTSGFLFQPMRPHPALNNFIETQRETFFDIKFVVGTGDRQMPITGLLINLKNKKSYDTHHPPLPGADGPNPTVSTGARSLAIVKDPQLITTNGRKEIEFLNGCWEMVWRDDKPTGALICGFNHQNVVRRNDALFSPGRVYISFPFWTREGLKVLQNEKRREDQRAEIYLKDKHDEISKMNKSNNPLMKALHYRNAFAAAERILFSETSAVNEIPDDSDVVTLKEDLMLCTKGTIWQKKDSLFGDEHVLIGYAALRPTIDPSMKP